MAAISKGVALGCLRLFEQKQSIPSLPFTFFPSLSSISCKFRDGFGNCLEAVLKIDGADWFLRVFIGFSCYLMKSGSLESLVRLVSMEIISKSPQFQKWTPLIKSESLTCPFRTHNSIVSLLWFPFCSLSRPKF